MREPFSWIKWRICLVTLMLTGLLASVQSCRETDLSDVYGRLDELEQRVTTLESAVAALERYYAAGSIIVSVTPITQEGRDGWTITFSDGKELQILNGEDGKDGNDGHDGRDGVTPYVKIDQGGHWAVSYDNGATFQQLQDEEGNAISAQGADGEDGLSVRVVIGEDGHYVIETYIQSDPSKVVSSMPTPYVAEPGCIITSLSQDDKTHAVTIALADGRTFTFGMEAVRPTSIALLAVRPLYLSWGTQASVEFRVNPSDATFKMDGEDAEIALDFIGTVDTSRDARRRAHQSYVTTPRNYRLVRVEQVYDGDTGEMKVGQYRAIIEDTQRSMNYDEMVALVLTLTDADGRTIQVSSSAFEIRSTITTNLRTQLPVLVVNTPGSNDITSRENWMTGTTMSLLDVDGKCEYQGTASVKGRGNSSWDYPKKSYNLRLDTKHGIAGMASHKRWCLLANWIDRTMIRNAVAFEVARYTDMEWTPSGEFVELVLNGKHMGTYYLCEQVRLGTERVPGDYLFELDKYYDEIYKFRSERRDLPWMFKEPDEVSPELFQEIQDYVNAMEDAIYDSKKFAEREYAAYMDLDTFADWWIVNELITNAESQQPKSVYMYKKSNGKLKAGPIWDCDYCTFYPGFATKYLGTVSLYYNQLYRDYQFRSLIREHWLRHREDFLRIPDFIDELGQKLASSDALNHPMWPIYYTVNEDENLDYTAAIERLKQTYSARFEWLDARLANY